MQLSQPILDELFDSLAIEPPLQDSEYQELYKNESSSDYNTGLMIEIFNFYLKNENFIDFPIGLGAFLSINSKGICFAMAYAKKNKVNIFKAAKKIHETKTLLAKKRFDKLKTEKKTEVLDSNNDDFASSSKPLPPANTTLTNEPLDLNVGNINEPVKLDHALLGKDPNQDNLNLIDNNGKFDNIDDVSQLLAWTDGIDLVEGIFSGALSVIVTNATKYLTEDINKSLTNERNTLIERVQIKEQLILGITNRVPPFTLAALSRQLSINERTFHRR